MLHANETGLPRATSTSPHTVQFSTSNRSQDNAAAAAPQHITADVFSADTHPLWSALLADAQQFPTVPVCRYCELPALDEEEDTSPLADPLADDGYYVAGLLHRKEGYCPTCGYELVIRERNDLADALRIAQTDPASLFTRSAELKIERRHLLAVVSHCLLLTERVLAVEVRQ